METITIPQLKRLKESEDKVEFKEAKRNYSFAGSKTTDQEERRRCFLGYVVAFANEGGGLLVFGMSDKPPRVVVGTDFGKGKIGELADETYARLGIRVRLEELYENGLRVLVTHIPSRPIGKLLKFEGVPLMRIGESLRNMSDEEMFSVLSEQEPDYSEKICQGLGMSDLDPEAIKRLKEAYARKQDNPQFLTLSDAQAISDLSLAKSGHLTYAALILLGKKAAIQQYLPQAIIQLEFRNTPSQINFDQRQTFDEAYFTLIDKLWEAVNHRNGKIPIQQGVFIFDIPFFNKEVIREAINNAVAHRDYRKTSEVVIRQYPNAMHIVSPGGFPLGVSLENLLVVNSTPRNRLLTDVLAKTGVVERSGQGIDKIYYQTLSEAKPEPDYTHSDNYQVELRLSAVVEDQAFALFIKEIQQGRNDEGKLSIQDIVTLNRIRKGDEKHSLNPLVLQKLSQEGLIEKVGKTSAQRFILSKAYHVFTNKTAVYAAKKPLDDQQIGMLIGQYLSEFEHAKMGDFQRLLQNYLSRDQVRYLVAQWVQQGFLEKEGKLKGTIYRLSNAVETSQKRLARAIELGLEEMKKRGEFPDA
jgi:ATP-dependent DNA helicase RecG